MRDDVVKFGDNSPQFWGGSATFAPFGKSGPTLDISDGFGEVVEMAADVRCDLASMTF